MQPYDLNDYDFIDFGCKTGGSMLFAQRNLKGKRGLGIDLSAINVKTAKEAGYDCLQADVTELDLPDKCVDFVIMSHFLEHLPSEESVRDTIGSAIRLSRKFVYIQGPWFDADEYLRKKGLKFYWSDWHGHPTHVDSHMIARSVVSWGHYEYHLYGAKPITDSANPTIHPIKAPPDKHQYIPEYGEKKVIKFAKPLFAEMVCIIDLGGFFIKNIKRLKKGIIPLEKLLDSKASGVVYDP